MLVNKNTKVLVLPESAKALQVIKLPDVVNNRAPKAFVIGEEGILYELREVNGYNPYDDQASSRPVVPKTGEPIKTMVFEMEGGGFVLSGANMVVSSRFNFSYFLISLFWSNQSLNKRFMNLDDICDTLSGYYEQAEWVHLIPVLLYKSSLNQICDTIEENGDTFYKFSQERVEDFLHLRIAALAAFLKERPEMAIVYKIKLNLYPPLLEDEQNSIPTEILEMAILRNCVDLIVGSYLQNDIRLNILKKYSFDKLDEYLTDIQAQRKQRELAEAQLDSVVEITSRNEKKSSKGKQTTSKKKMVKKVAAGKGALDAFFKMA